MVIHVMFRQLLKTVILAQQPVPPILELDPRHRAIVITDMFLLVLTGLLLLACVMVGAHWVRRLARQKPRSQQSAGDSASRLANKRLRKSLRTILPNVDTSATVQIDTSTGDTKIDDKPRPKDNT